MVSTKTERKVMKKMSRVMAASSDQQPPAQTSTAAAAVPRALVPAPLPANENLMTRREVLLKKSFARRAKKEERSAVSTSGKKKPEKATRSSVAKVTLTPGPHQAAPVATPKNNGQFKSKLVTSALHAVAKQQTHPKAQPITSQNLSAARRHDFFVKELNQFNKVLALPEFTKDPFAAIESHLDATMKRLEPQTADFGRRPDQHGHAAAGPQAKITGKKDPRQKVASNFINSRR